MSVVNSLPKPAIDRRKWLLFAVLGVAALLAIYADEKFLFIPGDPEWPHIAPFQWWLLPHALAGAVALVLGPFQFSTRLRQRRVALHRLLGKIYIGAVCIAAPLSIVLGLYFEPPALRVQTPVQGLAWLICALLAYLFAVKRNIPLHRQWVARSYGFTFIFIASRVPDFFHWHWKDDAAFANFLWCLMIAALVVPDLILQWDALLRPSRPAVK